MIFCFRATTNTMASAGQTTTREDKVTSNVDKVSTKQPLPDVKTVEASHTTNQSQPIQDQQAEAKLNPRVQALSAKKDTLASTLADLQSQKATLVNASTLPSGLSIPDTWTDEEKATSAFATANGVIKDHISLLHKYNEIKDIAQGLMGLIAEARGVRQKVVEEEYGMGKGD